MNRLIALVITLLVTGIACAQGTDELNQRTQKYGFEVKNLTNLFCLPETSGKPWYTICVSNTRERTHTVVAWRLPSTKKVDVQMSFGGSMLSVKGESVAWHMNCKSDPSFQDPTNMGGSIVDCDWTSPDPLKAKVYATFFYFVPVQGASTENVMIFSDFGKGEGTDETKKRARTFLQEGNLFKTKGS